MQFTRRALLHGIAGGAGASLFLRSPGSESIRRYPNIQLSPVSNLIGGRPLDIRSALHTYSYNELEELGGLLKSLGTQLVRDVMVPGSTQQEFAMKMWGKLGIGVIGIVSVPGDTEAHVRRRIRTAAKYRDVIFELEVESNSVFPEHSHGKIFHYQLNSLPITTSNTARSFAVGSDKVLRCWLTDLNVRQESNAASSPFWPVLGDYGLIERKRNALTPSAGFFAIKRLNSLARSIPTAPSRAPEFYTNSPAGLFTRAWVTPEGRTIIASWWPYGRDVRYNKLEIATSQPVRWQFIEPSRTSAYSPIMHGQAWSGNITNHPLLLLVDPY